MRLAITEFAPVLRPFPPPMSGTLPAWTRSSSPLSPSRRHAAAGFICCRSVRCWLVGRRAPPLALRPIPVVQLKSPQGLDGAQRPGGGWCGCTRYVAVVGRQPNLSLAISIRHPVVAGVLHSLRNCGWVVGCQRERAQRQADALKWIRGLGGFSQYDWEVVDWTGLSKANAEPPGPAWLDEAVGVDFVSGVFFVELGDSKITDAGLERLHELSNLTGLNIDGTKVTDTGLEHLNGLVYLEHLDLRNTQITDAGLEHLKGLAELRDLLLDATGVTDAGVNKLRSALPNCQIHH